MNIAVGTITPLAQQAIEAAGGHVDATLSQHVWMVVLPNGAEMVSSISEYAYITLPGD